MQIPENLLNKIVIGDCLSVMKEIPAASIDMILCDLPYGVTSRNKWDKQINLEKLWEQYKRVIKSDGVIALTATHPFAAKLIVSNEEMFRYDWVWRKNKSTGFLNAKKMPLRNHESVLIFYKKLPLYRPQKTVGHKPVNSFTKRSSDGSNYGKTKIGYSGGHQTDRYPTSVINFAVVNNDSKEKFHPTQKPVDLFEYLIRTYTREGEVVLDSCIGSGTTAIAAMRSKRNFVGIEKNPKYAEKAKNRINSTIVPILDMDSAGVLIKRDELSQDSVKPDA